MKLSRPLEKNLKQFNEVEEIYPTAIRPLPAMPSDDLRPLISNK